MPSPCHSATCSRSERPTGSASREPELQTSEQKQGRMLPDEPDLYTDADLMQPQAG